MAGLKDRYCIVGVGETEYSKHSGRSTRAMAVEAVKTAMTDAGLKALDVDGMMFYQGGDSTPANWVAPDLGIRLNFYMDVFGGGSSTEALVGLAMGAIESGMCNTVAIFRSMNGYSDFRIGGTGARAAQPVRGLDLAQVPFGMRSAGQNFAPTFMRHMYEYGTTSEQVAAVRVAHSKHASQNPKALLKDRVTVADVVGSRWICKPLHLLECCVETDNATCIIVTSAERARDLAKPPVFLLGMGQGFTHSDLPYAASMTTVAMRGASERAYAMAQLGPDDIDVAELYDCFTSVVLLTLEDYGFCKKGEGGKFVEDGRIELGGALPVNTGGGLLSQAHASGCLLVTEAAIQMRGAAGARQVAGAETAIVSGQCGVTGINVCLILGKHPD
jgi:acetyl-CoA acetyltransferase